MEQSIFIFTVYKFVFYLRTIIDLIASVVTSAINSCIIPIEAYGNAGGTSTACRNRNRTLLAKERRRRRLCSGESRRGK